MVRLKLALALTLIFPLFSCHQKTESQSSCDCRSWDLRLDTLEKVNQDTVLALVPLALRACSLQAGQQDSLTVAILEHALRAADAKVDEDRLLLYSRQMLAIDTARYGPQHLLTASARLWVAKALYRAGQFAAAESLLLPVREMLEPHQNEYPEQYVRCLALVVSTYAEQGRLNEAAECAESELKASEHLLGPRHSLTLNCRQHLGVVYRNQGRYREAQELLEREIEVFVPLNVTDSIELAVFFSALGNTLQAQAKYAEAETMFLRCIEIQNRIYGERSTPVNEYFALGELLLDEGRYHKAEQYYLQALRIRRADSSPNHPGIAQVLNSLGMLYLSTGQYEKAEEVLSEALRILTKVYGPEGVKLSTSLTRLGLVNVARGDIDAAEPYIRRALEIRQRAFDSTHVLVAFSQLALAQVEAARGHFTEAQRLCERALATFELRYGSMHQATFQALRQLAVLEAQDGRIEDSRARFSQMCERSRECLHYVFSFSSEANKLCWIRKYPLLDDAVLTIALADSSRRWNDLAYDMVLQGKCAVLDAVAAERSNAFCSEDSEIKSLLESRTSVCDAVASIALRTFAGTLPTGQDTLGLLTARLDSLDEQLSRQCSVYQSSYQQSRIRIADIAESLDDSTVLWDFVQYKPYDLTLAYGQKQRTDIARYMAFAVGRKGIESMVDLGPAAPIDSLIAETRQAVNRAGRIINRPELGADEERQLREVTGALYKLVFAPLARTLAGRRTICISPDASLNLLPVDILPLPDGRYAVEEFSISYVTTARDLVTYSGATRHRGQAVVFADPDYDGPQTAQWAVQPASARTGATERSIYGCLAQRYAQLPGSRREGELIGSIFRRQPGWMVHELYAAQASEKAFKKFTISPAVLHIATHGFFCPNEQGSFDGETDNPLLRSGLLLAGANLHLNTSESAQRVSDDGVLTALEISAMDLSHTDLAVLSSCESGMGDVTDGDGVLGLRRAFRQANCKALIVSMWAVPDQEAVHLMEKFYEYWLSGVPTGQSFRNAELYQLARSRTLYGHGHPVMWGSYTLCGSPD